MSGKLTTHVLDTANGRPAAGMHGELARYDGEQTVTLKQFVTNTDGRTSEPLLQGTELQEGIYSLTFDVVGYFEQIGSPDAGKFLGMVPLIFIVSDATANYHVPLLVSPWSYSTYRGS